jgi:hypothetical protein
VQRADFDFGTHVYPHIVVGRGAHGSTAGARRVLYDALLDTAAKILLRSLGFPFKYNGNPSYNGDSRYNGVPVINWISNVGCERTFAIH